MVLELLVHITLSTGRRRLRARSRSKAFRIAETVGDQEGHAARNRNDTLERSRSPFHASASKHDRQRHRSTRFYPEV
jgi:hypothetical protein